MVHRLFIAYKITPFTLGYYFFLFWLFKISPYRISLSSAIINGTFGKKQLLINKNGPMKTSLHIKTTLFQAIFFTIALFGITSCANPEKTEDTKEIAKDQNEELYDNTRKEKDALFLVNAAEICLKEIQLGQLAQQASKTEDIKKLGKMIEEEHRKSLDQLIIIADKNSIIIPKSLTDDALEANKKLINTLQENFDVEFCNMMVISHRDAITLFDKASTESTNLDIKEWATDTLPYLQSHLDFVMICQAKYDVKK